jgi:hypothetical protein
MDQQILQGLMCMCVHFPLDMHSKLKEMDQEISQGLMCIFIIIYVLNESLRNRPRDPSRTYVLCVYSCLELY